MAKIRSWEDVERKLGEIDAALQTLKQANSGREGDLVSVKGSVEYQKAQLKELATAVSEVRGQLVLLPQEAVAPTALEFQEQTGDTNDPRLVRLERIVRASADLVSHVIGRISNGKQDLELLMKLRGLLDSPAELSALQNLAVGMTEQALGQSEKGQ